MNSFTDKVQLGTNIRTSQDGIEDTEVEMLLSSQLHKQPPHIQRKLRVQKQYDQQSEECLHR